MECGKAFTGTLQNAKQKNKGESVRSRAWVTFESQNRGSCAQQSCSIHPEEGKYIHIENTLQLFFLFVTFILVEGCTSNCFYCMFQLGGDFKSDLFIGRRENTVSRLHRQCAVPFTHASYLESILLWQEYLSRH